MNQYECEHGKHLCDWCDPCDAKFYREIAGDAIMEGWWGNGTLREAIARLSKAGFRQPGSKVRVPTIGSKWVWEPNKPHAREIVTVTKVFYNFREWWVHVVGDKGNPCSNDLDRFTEACIPYDKPLNDVTEWEDLPG